MTIPNQTTTAPPKGNKYDLTTVFLNLRDIDVRAITTDEKHYAIMGAENLVKRLVAERDALGQEATGLLLAAQNLLFDAQLAAWRHAKILDQEQEA